MGIKLGSVILTILFLFVAKISFEATMMNNDTPAPSAYASTTSASRGPASVSSIDDGYEAYMNGPQLEETPKRAPAKIVPVP